MAGTPRRWPRSGTAERLATLLVTEHTLARRGRSHLLQALVRMGETQRVERALAEMDGAERDSGEMRIAVAALRLAQDDPQAATVALAPVIEGSAPLTNAHLWEVQAFLLDAIARDALGDAVAARRALERALDAGQAGRPAVPVPGRSRAGPARAPPPARHRARRPDLGDPERAGRPEARPAAG